MTIGMRHVPTAVTRFSEHALVPPIDRASLKRLKQLEAALSSAERDLG